MKPVRHITCQRRRAVRAELIERDGTGCWLCGDPIDLGLHYEDPMSIFIDHVLPRSRGGRNLLPNLRLAHRRCNEQRSDALAPAFPATNSNARGAVSV